MVKAIDDLRAKIGTSAPQFVDSVKPLAPSKPSPVAFNVSGQAGVGFTVNVVTPQNIQPASSALARAKVTKGPNAPLTPLLHNIQSATDTNFNSASNLIDYGTSSQSAFSINASGQTRYWRIRSSFDGQNWNNWQLLTGATGPIAVSV